MRNFIYIIVSLRNHNKLLIVNTDVTTTTTTNTTITMVLKIH